MDTIGARIKEVMRLKAIRVDDICELIGKKQPTISSYLTNRTFPNEEFFIGIVKLIPDLNLHWLLTGQTTMFIEKEKKSIEKELQDLKIRENEMTQAIISMSRLIAQPQAQQSKLKGVLNTGNFLQIGGRIFCAPKHTVIGTPQFTH